MTSEHLSESPYSNQCLTGAATLQRRSKLPSGHRKYTVDATVDGWNMLKPCKNKSHGMDITTSLNWWISQPSTLWKMTSRNWWWACFFMFFSIPWWFTKKIFSWWFSRSQVLQEFSDSWCITEPQRGPQRGPQQGPRRGCGAPTWDRNVQRHVRSWGEAGGFSEVDGLASWGLDPQGFLVCLVYVYEFVWKCRVPKKNQWFCWSLSLWKMAIIGNIPNIFRETLMVIDLAYFIPRKIFWERGWVRVVQPPKTWQIRSLSRWQTFVASRNRQAHNWNLRIQIVLKH